MDPEGEHLIAPKVIALQLLRLSREVVRAGGRHAPGTGGVVLAGGGGEQGKEEGTRERNRQREAWEEKEERDK